MILYEKIGEREMKRLFLMLFLSGSVFAHHCMPNKGDTSIPNCAIKQLVSDPCGQVLVGQLVELLNGQMRVLDLLIANKTGAVIDQMRHNQNILFNKTDPAVVKAYGKIMETATFNQKLIQQSANCCPRLGCKDRRRFLHCARYILGCYQQQLRRSQCKIDCGSCSA